MIQNFVFILNNGIRTKVGEFLPDVPLLQQINDPEFHPRAYAWESGGHAFTRLIDGCETMTARALPDGSGIVVLQDHDTYGSDNVVILDPTNDVRRRVINPYSTSRYFMAGDRFWFDALSVHAGEVALNIQVHRKLPGKPYDASPLYEACYDPSSWSLKELGWKPST